MEQYKKIVLEAPEGMRFITNQGKNGELVIRLMPNSQLTGKATFFTTITEDDREKVRMWLADQKCVPDWAEEFVKIVQEAVREIDYDYSISILEPSVKNEKIYYGKDEAVAVEYSIEMWDKMAKEYAPERGSRIGKIHELFLWYALRIANEKWTLEYVALDSAGAGNYWDAEDASHELEKTSARRVGGYEDGQGNTCKIVSAGNDYAIVGGCCCYKGKQYPVANVNYECNFKTFYYRAVGVLVLEK